MKLSMNLIGRACVASALTFGLLGAPAAFAQSESDTEQGKLTCEVAGGVGLILGSSKALECTFEKKDGGIEKYEGKIKKLGIDIGVTKESTIIWRVFAPTNNYGPGALAGKYVGLSAEVTVVGGVGANVLVGGSKDTFSLQPLSVQKQKGLNIAAGLGSISLEFVQ
ncbi:MAG: DUF992 domain-containing protein [Paracoccaceae bacterium]